MRSVYYLFGFLLFLGCSDQDIASESYETVDLKVEAEFEDESAVNEVVKNAYKLIGFSPDKPPDYNALKSIFTDDAVLMHFRFDTLSKSNITEFLKEYKNSVESESFTGFDEIEISGETEGFGKIAHRISTYGSYINGADTLGERGINSFQLIKLNNAWKISSIIWDVEKASQPIPDHYTK
jgi:hypothetical protein